MKGFTFLVLYRPPVISAMDVSLPLHCIFPRSGETVVDELTVFAAGTE